MRNIYLIKDVARISGHSTHTLKYYLRSGLLHEIGRSPATNFRYFDDTSIERLRLIRDLRSKKVSISEIRRQLEESGDEIIH